MLTSFQVQALLTAALWTIGLALIAFIGGGAVGLIVAVARVSANRVIAGLAFFYVQIVQGTPLLIQMMLAYFGLSIIGQELPPFAAASLAMIVYASAYFGEIWRGGILSVPRMQWEAAECLALSPIQRFWLVIVPQALRVSTPPTVGFMVQVVKNTSLASIIGYVDIPSRSLVAVREAGPPSLVGETADPDYAVSPPAAPTGPVTRWGLSSVRRPVMMRPSAA